MRWCVCGFSYAKEFIVNTGKARNTFRWSAIGIGRIQLWYKRLCWWCLLTRNYWNPCGLFSIIAHFEFRILKSYIKRVNNNKKTLCHPERRENKNTQPLQCYSLPRWPGYLVKAVCFNDWYVISITLATTVWKSSLAKSRTTAMKVISQLIKIHGTPFKSKTNNSAPHNEKRHHTKFMRLLF